MKSDFDRVNECALLDETRRITRVRTEIVSRCERRTRDGGVIVRQRMTTADKGTIIIVCVSVYSMC